MRGSLKKKKWLSRYNPWTTAAVVHTGDTRQQAGPRKHGEVTGPRVRIKLPLCVSVGLTYRWLVRHFPTSLRPVGYVALGKQHRTLLIVLKDRDPSTLHLSRETIGVECTMFDVEVESTAVPVVLIFLVTPICL